MWFHFLSHTLPFSLTHIHTHTPSLSLSLSVCVSSRRWGRSPIRVSLERHCELLSCVLFPLISSFLIQPSLSLSSLSLFFSLSCLTFKLSIYIYLFIPFSLSIWSNFQSIYLFISLYLCLSLSCLIFYLSLSLYISIYVYLSHSLTLSFLSLSFFVSLYLSVYQYTGFPRYSR